MPYEDAKRLSDTVPGLEAVGMIIPQGYAVVDLDNCINEEDGLNSTTQSIVDTLDSYTEYSPSGKGLHIIVQCDLKGYPKLATNANGQSVEVLTPGNFCTFTSKSIREDHTIRHKEELKGFYICSNVKPRKTTEVKQQNRMGGSFHKCRYGAAALRGECDKIRRAWVGSRTTTLLRGAFRIGRLIPGGHLDRGEAVEELVAAGCSAGLDLKKVERTVEKGLHDGMQQPRHVVCDEIISVKLVKE